MCDTHYPRPGERWALIRPSIFQATPFPHLGLTPPWAEGMAIRSLSHKANLAGKSGQEREQRPPSHPQPHCRSP